MSSLVWVVCWKHSLEEFKNLVFRTFFCHHLSVFPAPQAVQESKTFPGPKNSPKFASVEQDSTSREAAVECAGAAAGWWCHLEKPVNTLAVTGQRPFQPDRAPAWSVTTRDWQLFLSTTPCPVDGAYRLRLNSPRWLVKGAGCKLWESCCALFQAAWATKAAVEAPLDLGPL